MRRHDAVNAAMKERKNSKAEIIMQIDGSILEKYGSRSGRDLEKYKDEFIQAVRAAGISKISKAEADQLEDENYHTALDILTRQGFVSRN